MAVVDITRAARASVQSFGGHQRDGWLPGYRLPPARRVELQTLFLGVESMMGLKTGYWVDFEHTMGVRHTASGTEDQTELIGPEKWCAAREKMLCRGVEGSYVMGRDRGLDPLWRARRALQAIAHDHVVTLWRAYGPADPQARSVFAAEVAAIVPFVDAVEHVRQDLAKAMAATRILESRVAGSNADAAHVGAVEMWRGEERELEVLIAERAAKEADASARTSDLDEKFRKTKKPKAREKLRVAIERRVERALRRLERTHELAGRLEEMRARHVHARKSGPVRGFRGTREVAEEAIRGGAYMEVSRSAALAHALRIPSATCTQPERVTAMEAQKVFIAKATRQANERLIEASKAYQDAWRAHGEA